MPPASSQAPAAPAAPERFRVGRKLALAVATAVLTLLVAELGLRLVQWMRGRTYVAQRVELRLEALQASLADGVPRSDEPASGERPRHKASELLHPYIGFEHPHYVGQLEQQLAYFSTERSREVFDVFVFGGSVAGGFSSIAPGLFRELLRADPRLRERPIHVWVEGRAAHKQPQQALLLAYLLCAGAEPDAVIALDGFNEVAVALQNVRAGVLHTYPYLPAWLARAGGTERNRNALEHALELHEQRASTLASIERLRELGIPRLALTGELGLSFAERAARRVTEDFLRFQERLATDNGTDQLAPPSLAGSDEESIERCVRTWVAGSRALAGTCRVRGIPFLQVLQPTLHDEGTKPLHPREIESGTTTEEWITGVRLGYPMLRAAGAELARSGIAFLDATRVFEHEANPLYIDACHFNQAGYALLARAIAPALLAALGDQERPNR